MEKIDKRTYSDLVIILGMMSKDMREKINPKFIKTIIDNSSKDYKSDIIPYIPLKEQKLSKQTEAFLAMMYKDYFETKEINEAEMQILDISKEKKIGGLFDKIKSFVKNLFRGMKKK